ncbi:3-beta-hydroxysteroid-Delta(8),Delta(7)-isomerase [Aspergillus californicus]
MNPLHSYYPVGTELPDYAPNELATISLLFIFAITVVIIFAGAYSFATRINPGISKCNLSTVFWFTLCGFIHLGLEGYYSLNFSTLTGSQHILAQLWKEYSLSDSRYLTQHAFVMCMETITAFAWGPLSFLLAVFIATENPFRHPLQLIISLGQLYGNILYLGTCAFDLLVYGIEYSRPEGYYFYGYFVFMNAIWIVIPIGLMYESISAIGGAFADVKKLKMGANGAAKKRT